MGRLSIAAGTVVSLALFAGCDRGGSRTDTGYVGTWERRNARQVITLSLAQVDGDYRFRLARRAADGQSELECDWEGACSEYVNRDLTRQYRFSPRVDPATGELIVEYDVWVPSREHEAWHYVDRLTVEPGGSTLRVVTVQRNGENLPEGARPTRWFSKVNDRVESPPARGT